MNRQTYRVTLTPADGAGVRSIHYVQAHTCSEARNDALLQQIRLDMEDGNFRRWAAIVIQPMGSTA